MVYKGVTDEVSYLRSDSTHWLDLHLKTTRNNLNPILATALSSVLAFGLLLFVLSSFEKKHFSLRASIKLMANLNLTDSI